MVKMDEHEFLSMYINLRDELRKRFGKNDITPAVVLIVCALRCGHKKVRDIKMATGLTEPTIYRWLMELAELKLLDTPIESEAQAGNVVSEQQKSPHAGAIPIITKFSAIDDDALITNLRKVGKKIK
jgi:hypothetical protein